MLLFNCLAFCLAAGSLTLFMSLLAIVAGFAVREAVADGRFVSRIILINLMKSSYKEIFPEIWKAYDFMDLAKIHLCLFAEHLKYKLKLWSEQKQ